MRGSQRFPILIGKEAGASSNIRATRARTQGHIPLPLSYAAPTMIYSAAKLWNESQDLRSAKTLTAVKSIAKRLAKAAPI